MADELHRAARRVEIVQCFLANVTAVTVLTRERGRDNGVINVALLSGYSAMAVAGRAGDPGDCAAPRIVSQYD
jgi:hypothetical protein